MAASCKLISQTACSLSLSPSSHLGICRQCPEACCSLQRSCLCSAAKLLRAPLAPGTWPSSGAEEAQTLLSLPMCTLRIPAGLTVPTRQQSHTWEKFGSRIN